MSITHTPDSADKAVAQAIASQLPVGDLRLDGIDRPLPPAVAAMLRQVLETFAAGEPVALITQDSEVTPNEAAAFLNVSRGTVTKLMEDGILPYNQVGSHRRIPGAAVAAYKVQQQVKSRAAMDELVRLSEGIGLYTDPQPMPPKAAYRNHGDRTK